ncbi:fatty acid desaturase [Legionella feeleii]|uniref:Fatty acid desaturase n=1 Tax=Legionella feeleii TaxID=453 RepID=A0A0W0TKN1_9GAMM|nr:fatty acid desaturase [Legionella feeleii]SPX60209.1 Fatty acid desaturase [Legionella feeleii]
MKNLRYTNDIRSLIGIFLNTFPFDIYKYIATSNWRGLGEITLNFVLLILGLVILQVALSNHYWPLLILIIPLALLFTRLFVLQHDLGHGNLFKKRKYNDWVGVFTGIILFTPYFYWRKAHAIHHANGGNADTRPWVGDIKLLTVREYEAKSRWGKLVYQLYRNSFVMFFLGWIYVFGIDQRFFRKRKGFGKKEHRSVIITNLGILLLYGPIIAIAGLKFFLIAILLPQWLAGALGIYLFYVQHNFKHRYFVSSREWNLLDSALKGSTFYDLPQPFKWLTANIGYHHIHTLAPRIPFYRLAKCHKENDCFSAVPKFGLKNTKELISLKLYDEEMKQMITWKEYKAHLANLTSNIEMPRSR